MPRTDHTTVTEVRTTAPLTVDEVAAFLAAADRAGIPGDHPVQVYAGGHHVIPRLTARLERDAAPVEPVTQRLPVPLRAGDRAGYLVAGTFVLGTVEEVAGDLLRWRSDAPEGMAPITATAPVGDFARLNATPPASHPSIGRLQP
jgi:hypothetical protein